MVELTEDELSNFIMLHIDSPATYEQLSQMIIEKFNLLDDYEKARKWDYLTEHGLTNEQVKHELTLVDLIEKRIKELKKEQEEINKLSFGLPKSNDIRLELTELQKLLKESKK